MLTPGASVASVALATEAIHYINADTVVYAGVAKAVVHVSLARLPFPPWLADALAVEEAVHADAMHTGIHSTQFHFLVAALAGESRGTVAHEVVSQVGAVGAEEAGVLSTVIDVDLAGGPRPPWWTLAFVATLHEWHTKTPVATGALSNGARVDSDVAGGTLVAGPAQAVNSTDAWQILAHGTIRASVVQAVTLFLLALESTVACRALARVPLRMIKASAAIVTRHAVALVHVGLAELSCKAGWAVADSLVVLGHT